MFVFQKLEAIPEFQATSMRIENPDINEMKSDPVVSKDTSRLTCVMKVLKILVIAHINMYFDEEKRQLVKCSFV